MHVFWGQVSKYSFLRCFFFRTTRNVPSLVRENLLGHNREDIECLHQILNFLFSLLPNAKHYTDLHTHATAKLVAYFQTMSHFLLGPTEKLLFEPHFPNLWQLFHPKLSEPAIPGRYFDIFLLPESVKNCQVWLLFFCTLVMNLFFLHTYIQIPKVI